MSELPRETAETVLKSPCGSYAESVWDEEILAAAEADALTPEQKKLSEQENRLLAEYNEKCAQEYTVGWNGKQITFEEMEQLYVRGEISASQWNALYAEMMKKENAVLGPIYLELVQVRNSYAQTMGMDEFRPDDPISRQDMALMTAAFAEAYGTEFPRERGRTFPFKDQKQIADYALDAVLELRKNGVLVGYPDETFGPERKATREEAAAVAAKLLP